VALEQVTFKPKGIETKMAMSGLDRAAVTSSSTRRAR
jgi:hypothetical protein